MGSLKQLVRWLEEPRFVSEGEDAQVLACYNENQFNVEDIFMPRQMVEQFQEQLQAKSMQEHQQSMTNQASLAAARAVEASKHIPRSALDVSVSGKNTRSVDSASCTENR